MANTVFITGTNRGLGYEFTKQYAEDGWQVLACCRNPKAALDLKGLASKFPNIEILKLDVSSERDCIALQDKLKQVPIDILINNAGMIETSDFHLKSLTQQEILKLFTVNSIAPLLVARALLPNLKLGKLKIVGSITSSLGSLTENVAGEWNHYAYKASKAALNMLMISLAAESELSDFRILLLNPGWVKTDMGGAGAALEPKESIAGLRKVLLNKKFQTGSCVSYNGEVMPW